MVLLLMINLVLLIAGTFVETSAALILLVPMIASLVPAPGHRHGAVGGHRGRQPGHRHAHPAHGHLPSSSPGSIAGQSLGAVSRRIWPFLGVLLIDLLIISFFPPLTMWLAKAVGK